MNSKNSYPQPKLAGAWMLHKGETQAWPQIVKVLEDIKSEDAATVQMAVQTIEDRFGTWHNQVRKSCLQVTVKEALITLFTAQCKKHQKSEENDTIEADMNNKELCDLLHNVRQCSKFFPDVRFQSMLNKLRELDTKVNAMHLVEGFLTAIQCIPTGVGTLEEGKADDLKSIWTRLLEAMPQTLGIIPFSDAQDQDKVVQAMLG